MSENQTPQPQADAEPGEEPWWFPMARAWEYAVLESAEGKSQAELDRLKAKAFARMGDAARQEFERAAAGREPELHEHRREPGGRAHFPDPSPGDFPGQGARQHAERDLEAG